MSGSKKDDSSRDSGSGGSSPVSGAGLGLLSMIKNRKIMTIIGGILIAIGIAGMIAVGSNALSNIFGGGFSQQNQGTQFQMGQYVFMFILIAGLVVVIYSQIALQSEKAKARERR
jgi:ABC-type nitrate/sulfonate/bicarbonate transport system permease component